MKKNVQSTVRYTKMFLNSIAKAFKTGVGAIKGTVALIVAGGAVAVIVIVIVCLAAVVGGELTGTL